MITFPTSIDSVINRIHQVDVVAYGKTRNFYSGAVSYLSPYISRGVITLPFTLEQILKKHSYTEAEPFIFELAWREYFQRVWHTQGQNILSDLLNPQQDVAHYNHVKSIVCAETGIQAIDQQIDQLYNIGYMHNHARMYVASITCNLARAHWKIPAQWMYYHLLDGDLASNSLSWQWVAGTFSTKKYYCNQANINRFSGTFQFGTFADLSYDEILNADIPDILQPVTLPELPVSLSIGQPVQLDYNLPLLLYNSYNLDPSWRSEQQANRLLLLEPSHFKNFPISERVIDFILKLSQNIPNIKVFVGEVNDLPELSRLPAIYSKAHPAFHHYPGIKDPPQWMFPNAVLKNSFSSFWKSCQKTVH